MKKGYIYKIELQDEIYVGSTEQKLCQRQSNHNCSLKRKPHQKLYKKCIEQGIDKIECIWVADIEFNSTAEKRMIEEKYRKELNATLNSRRCYITEKERKEQDKKCVKEYYNNNREEILKYLRKYMSKYRNDNKKEINAKKLEKVECPKCKSIVIRSHLSRHQKTKKCIELSNNE